MVDDAKGKGKVTDEKETQQRVQGRKSRRLRIWEQEAEREIGSNLFLNDFGGWIAQPK
jgi:hypothetical protein